RDDLAQLKSEIRSEFIDAIWSRDMIASFVAGATAVASVAFGAPLPITGVVTAAGAPVTIGGVFASRRKFLKSGADLMRRHQLAYLYEARSAARPWKGPRQS